MDSLSADQKLAEWMEIMSEDIPNESSVSFQSRLLRARYVKTEWELMTTPESHFSNPLDREDG